MPLEDQAKGKLELLRGLKINDDTLELFVTSNGCTTKDDFVIQVNTGFTDVSPVELAVIRVRPDNCKMQSNVFQIVFTRSELGVNALFEATIANKVGDIVLVD